MTRFDRHSLGTQPRHSLPTLTCSARVCETASPSTADPDVLEGNPANWPCRMSIERLGMGCPKQIHAHIPDTLRPYRLLLYVGATFGPMQGPKQPPGFPQAFLQGWVGRSVAHVLAPRNPNQTVFRAIVPGGIKKKPGARLHLWKFPSNVTNSEILQY